MSGAEWVQWRGVWLTTGQPGSPLRPHDRIDAALLDRWPGSAVAVLGPHWGAAPVAEAARTGSVVVDSAARRHALSAALTKNDRPEPRWLDDTDPWPEAHDAVVIRAPQSTDLLRWRLQRLAELAPPGSPVVIAGDTWSEAQTRLVETFSGDAVSWTRQGKVQVAQASVPERQAPKDPPWSSWSGSAELDIWSLPGVFCHGRLDDGSAALIAALPEALQGVVMDLGCGPGVLGAVALRRGAARVIATDDSGLAIAATKRTLSGAKGAFETVHADAGASIPKGVADVVLCNPPFHQGRAQTGHIVDAMLHQARRILRPRGHFWLVCNRHLGHDRRIKRFFASCRLASEARGFKVFVARR